MRMRRRNNLEPRMARCQQIMIPAPQEMAGRWRSLMPEARQVRVEVGCGNVLFIAIEKVREAMVLAMERAQEMGLKNVFFLDMDVAKLGQCFAPGEVDLIYINFCDPWPRSKHAKRRLTFPSFLDQYAYALPLGGGIAFKTDNAPLFDWSLEQFAACGWQLKNVTHDLHKDGVIGVMTGYEEKFHALGTPICRCEACKTAETKVYTPQQEEA